MKIMARSSSSTREIALGTAEAGESVDSSPVHCRPCWYESLASWMADPGASDASDSGALCNFFRKPSKGRNIRKRKESEEGEDEEEEPQASILLQKSKKAVVHDNKLHFSSVSASSRRRATTKEDDEETVSSSTAFHFESSKEIQVNNDSRATATLETETDFTRDARAIREKTLKLAEEKLKGGSRSSGDDKIYRGIHGYVDHKAGFRREQTVAGEKAGGAHGPLRAPVHIRVSARFDYQPDICKDYKETGYCGYGDSCKFMHDRGDYKMGWQLEREWEDSETARKRALALGGGENDDGGANDGDSDDDDALPFACFICREPFEDPVVTKCKHYFCEHCALKHHQKNKKCFVCNKPTLGIFNTAREIKKRMAESK